MIGIKRGMTLVPIIGILVGCSGGQSSLTLKSACDQIGPIVREFGQVAPNQQRYAEYETKIKAVVDQGDANTKSALSPLADAMEAGSKASGAAATDAMMKFASASMAVLAKCQAAGSTGYHA